MKVTALYFPQLMTQAVQQRKKPFFSLTYREAFKHLGITELERWQQFDLDILELGLLREFFRLCEWNLERG